MQKSGIKREYILNRISFVSEIKKNNPETLFREVYDKFKLAAKAAGGIYEYNYSVGGYIIRLCFAGKKLIPYIGRAFEHLSVGLSSQPSLTIYLFESCQAGLQSPSEYWEEYRAVCDSHRYEQYNNTVQASLQIGDDILNIIDAGRGIALSWFNDADKIPYYECGAPLRVILNWWMKENSRLIVHAGSVGTVEGGVLLGGRGGSGKTTTSLACLDAGLQYVSDDYCLLSQEPVPYAYSLFCSAKVDVADINRFPRFKNSLFNSDSPCDEKAVYFLYKDFRKKISNGILLKAIMLPHISGKKDSIIKKTKASSALISLAPSTIFQLPGNDNATFKYLSRFVQKLPAYILEIGTDVSQIPDIIVKTIKNI